MHNDPHAHSPLPTTTGAPDGATILCISSYFKGNEFLEQCKREGWRVILLTLEPLLSKRWAREYIDEVFAVPSLYDRRAVVNSVSYLARTRDIRRVAALDDYDVEMAAHLREHLRVPGMGETTARYFRDKLAMRSRARDRAIPVPEFVHVLNYDRIREFVKSVPPPWLLKPRSEASSVGIKKIFSEDQLWPAIEHLGDARSNHLLERMIPGDVFHVDTLVSERMAVLAEVHQYRRPLLDLVQGGGVFGTRTVSRRSELERQIRELNERVIEHLGFVRGVMHTEYIRGQADGCIYFLESAARVGGANISDLVEASTGINLWREWAKIELAQGEKPYELPPRNADYAGLITSLSRQEWPDTSAYTDPEIVWRMSGNPYHVGLIVKASTLERVEELMNQYEPRITHDFMASLPPPPTATS